jgi:hypothetical protein
MHSEYLRALCLIGGHATMMRHKVTAVIIQTDYAVRIQ